MFANLH